MTGLSRIGAWPSCGARRVAQPPHLVDHDNPHVPARQWVLALPIRIRLSLASQPTLLTPVL